MKRLYRLLLIALTLIYVASSCSDKNELPIPAENNIPLVSQFVYDGLSLYYLWSDEMTSKKPTENDTDPKKYFNSLLYKTDTERNWSGITDNVDALMADFAGTSKTFGYSIGGFYQIDNNIYALIRYVFNNTPASEAGIERLDLIGKVNGQAISLQPGTNKISQRDLDILYGGNSATFTTYRLIDNMIVENKEVEVTPITTGTNPVLYSNIYPLGDKKIGDKKIGYLFYTNFIGNYNKELFEVFSTFKSEGVTDLILDLRYNPGGGISAASYLVSLFAPQESVIANTILTTLTYNKYLNNLFDENKWSRDTKLGVYREKDEPNPLVANLDLDKIYIITTGRSASASELTTFCSRAIMGESNVVHIGEATSGKYTASWTLHPYNSFDKKAQPIYKEEKLSAQQKEVFKNWAMQPIVAVYKDKDGKDFINPGYLEPDYMLEEGFGYLNLWKPLGDTKDVFLGQALYLITGDETYKPVEPTETRSNRIEMIELESGMDEAKPLLIDNMVLSPIELKEMR